MSIETIRWEELNSALGGYKEDHYRISSDEGKTLMRSYYADSYNLISSVQLFLAENFPAVKDDEGKYSFQLTARTFGPKLSKGVPYHKGIAHFVTGNAFSGMLRYLRVSSRGCIIPSKPRQYEVACQPFNTSVPLILSAYKKHCSIGYNEWDWSEDRSDRGLFLDKDHLDASDFYASDIMDRWTEEELMEFRTLCLEDKNGNTKNPVSVTKAVNQTDKEFKELPTLIKTGLLQLWVYSPQLYTPHSIHNFKDLDAPAPILFGQSVRILEAEKDWDFSDVKTPESKVAGIEAFRTRTRPPKLPMAQRPYDENSRDF